MKIILIIKKQHNNSFENKDKNNNIISSNSLIKNDILPKNNNIIIPNIKNDFKSNKTHFVKRNSYSYKTSYDNNIYSNKQKINSKNENQKHSDGVAQSAKNYIKYLSERNRLLKEEKDKELLSIEKQLDKFDSKKNFKNINKNNIYDIDYINNINNNYYIRNNNQFLKNKINSQISNSNLYNKNINIRRLSKLKEEYDQKYSFQPVINDNYRTDLTFNERLNIFNNISKQKKEELKNNFSNLKADENGQEFFKPNLISKQYYSNITKKNNINNNINNNNNNSIDEIENNDKIDVFSKNYLYYKKYNSDKEKLYNKYYYNYTNEPHMFSKMQSDKLLNEANHKAFCNLFNELDSDQDNLITSFNINLNNIPNNILKIIDPLLIELKEDNQSLNQEEFIKAMNKLFENISSVDRRQLINEYNNRRQKNLNDNNKYLNNYNKNTNNSRKNYSLIKKEKANSINNNNKFSNKRIITRSNISMDNNNFDNNYLSSRPKTPVYKTVKKNNEYNFFNNLNKIKSQKTIVNNNTNKLAKKHFMRIQKMMDDYSNKYKDTNNKKNLYNNCFDKYISYSALNSNITKNNCRDIILNENKKFSSINDCTFNNYIKNLN